MLDQFGHRLQDALDTIEETAGRSGVGSVLLGVALAIGVVVSGIVAFIAIFVVLVELIP